MKKSWKTTTTGIMAIIAGACGLYFAHPITQEIVMASAGTILLGIGLLFAKDSNVTGGDVQQ